MARLLGLRGYVLSIVSTLPSTLMKDKTSGPPQEGQGPFLERPGNLTSPISYFEIKFSRIVGCVLTSNEVHFVSLADNFTVQFSNLLKLLSRTKTKTAKRAR